MGFRDENDEYRISFGTGEYKLSIELKETCDITEQYRKNWKRDRKQRKAMEPSEDILTRSWQVVSSQQWNELTKQWVITTLKAPADIITQDVIDKLGFESRNEILKLRYLVMRNAIKTNTIINRRMRRIFFTLSLFICIYSHSQNKQALLKSDSLFAKGVELYNQRIIKLPFPYLLKAIK